MIVLAIVNLPALWTGAFYTENLTRDEDIPQYWTDAIAALDAGSHDTRVLEIPGADFAAYRWGQTVDPITPGLTDRPYVARELVPWGSPASADLLERARPPAAGGRARPAAIAPVARLMSVGAIVYRADLQTDRFDLVRAEPLWQLLTDPVPAVSASRRRFGTASARRCASRRSTSSRSRCRPNATDPPPVSVFPVTDAPSIVRQRRRVGAARRVGRRRGARRPREHRRARRRAASCSTPARSPTTPRAEVARSRSRTRCSSSPTRTASAPAGGPRPRHRRARPSGSTRPRSTKDESDNRLDLFPDAGTDAQTVVQTPGRRGEHEPLRRPGLVPARVPRGARVRRRHQHRVGGRRARQGHRREAAARPRPADHHRSR